MRTLVISIAMLALTGTAHAERQVIARLGDDVPIAAGRGWVIWSTPLRHGYGLTAWRGGVVADLPVAPHRGPFYPDVGTDARGRDVVTFSRRGDVHVVDLVTGSERALSVPRPAHMIDEVPSMWHGRVAFARYDRRHDDRVRGLLLWSPADRQLRRLRRGTTPRDHTDLFTWVGGIDLGPRRVTYLWGVAGDRIIGTGGGREIRAQELRSDRARLVASGYAGEVCTEGPDGFLLSPPVLVGSRIWFLHTETECYAQRSRVARYDSRRHRGRQGRIGGTILRFAADAGAIYVLTGHPVPDTDPGCPCVLERRSPPPLTKREPRYRPPTY